MKTPGFGKRSQKSRIGETLWLLNPRQGFSKTCTCVLPLGRLVHFVKDGLETNNIDSL